MANNFSKLITSTNGKQMYYGSRNGVTIDRVVIHHNATTNKDVAMNTWLVSSGNWTSANYEVTPTEIIGCVGEQFAAYHCGGTGGSDVPKMKNPNARSIGIENVNSTGAPSWQVAHATIVNCAKLVADICRRYNIPVDRQHILGHNEVTATACPGGINVDEVVTLAKKYSGSTQAPTADKYVIEKTPVATVKYDGKGSVRLVNASGKYIDKYLKPETRWKVSGVAKVPNVGLALKVGTDQYLPIKFTNWATFYINYTEGYGVNVVDSNLKQIKGSNAKFRANTHWKTTDVLVKDAKFYFGAGINVYIPFEYVKFDR